MVKTLKISDEIHRRLGQYKIRSDSVSFDEAIGLLLDFEAGEKA